jgi:hypothetical protein
MIRRDALAIADRLACSACTPRPFPHRLNPLKPPGPVNSMKDGIAPGKEEKSAARAFAARPAQ